MLQHRVLEAGVQLNTTIQAQTLAQVEGNLVEHKASVEKVTDAIGAGFAWVNGDLEQMGENIDLVRADVDSLDISMNSVLERLEILERQSTAKDSRILRCVDYLVLFEIWLEKSTIFVKLVQ